MLTAGSPQLPACAQPTASFPLQIVGAARPPYVSDAGDGTGSGPAAELVQQMAQALGLAPRIRILPFQRAVRELDRGHTLYPALMRTPQREHRYVWIGEVYVDRAVFFTRSTSPAVNGLDAARRLPRIAVLRGSELQGLLQSLALENFETSNSEADNARLLRAGRIDGWFTPHAVGRATWKELGFRPEELRSSDGFAVLPFWIAASANLPPETIAGLRAAYRAMRDDGRYRRIIARLSVSP